MLPGGDQEAVAKNPSAGNQVEPASIPFTAALELVGGDGNDIILGGDADDTLSGGDNDDRVEGGKGNDTLNGDAGIDTLNGDEGDDDLFGGTEGDKLQGGPGNDEAYGGPGIDLIQGGPGTGEGSTDGDDFLVGDEDQDSIEGGSGNDALFGDHAISDPHIDSVCDATDVSYDPADPAEAADKLTGGPGNDVLVGGAGPDEMFGGGANDRLCGNQGNDIMDGDQGSDVPAANAPATEQPGDDTVRGGAGSDMATGNLGNDFVHGGLHRDHVDGGAGNDDVAGGGGRDFAVGGAGLDIVVGDNADIDQGAANDKAARAVPIATSLVANIGTGTGGTATCSFVADDTDTGTADCIQGGDDPDLIFGEGGNDQIFAGNGNDVVFAGQGDDNPVRGEGGNDTMSGEDGMDTMFGDSGADTMFGNADADTMRGGIDDDYMEGNGALDTMFGEAAQDDIIGGSSEDGAADVGDVIDGGAAADVIVGDNGEITRPGGNDPDDATSVLRSVTLYDVGDPGVGGGDTIDGDLSNDQIWGGNGGDGITGEQGVDRVEGNDGIDTVNGGTGNDRIVGGSSSRATLLGPDGATPVAYDQAPDTGDFLHGNDADDVIAGDNATIAFDGVATMTGFDSAASHGDDEITGDTGQDRLYGQLGGDTITGDADEDYAIGDLGAITPGTPTGTWPGGAPKYEVRLQITPDNGGIDDVDGGDDDDHLFGGAANDVMRGQLGDDYMEGNGGQDSMYGYDVDVDTLSAGQTDEDDMIGGSSSWTRPGNIVRLDVGETVMQGNPDHDVMTGDNADIDRITNPAGTQWAPDEVIAGARKRIVTLLDRQRIGADLADVSGGDFMLGNSGSDRMLGEGGPDTVKGNADDDLLEGNQGSDWLEGNAGEDDVIGGSSFLASAGGNFPAGAAADLGDPDETDAIFGGAGGDVVAGDNAVIIRRTAGNTAAYNAALPSAYFTTDHEDSVPGWWLGVSTDRLVKLLDRTTLNPGRFGSDLISAGSQEDVAFGQDGNDWVSGGSGDDAIEGNGGNDVLFGDRAPALDGSNGEPAIPAPVAPGSALLDRDGAVTPDGEDDITGGSNASHRDGNDIVGGDGEDDFVIGDNGTLQRNIAALAYVKYPGDGSRDRIMRRATRLDVASSQASGVWGADTLRGNPGDDAMWGQDGNDNIYGEAGDDDLFGELGNDSMFGGTGQDAMIGDRGGLRNTVLGSVGALFSEVQYTFNSNGPPFVVYTGFRPGTYDRRVDLAQELPGSVGGPFVGQPAATLTSNGVVVGGNDLMRGGPDHDAIHGAFGDDIMNGDTGGDILFGADGSDVMWGGRGSASAATPDDRGTNDSLVDYIFGGRGGDPTNDTGVITGGADIIDYLPRVGVDPQAWHDAIAAYDDGAGGGETLRQHHQGVDWVYGGWDRDVMEGNLADNGPNPGDRLIDWTGAYNLYVHCNPAYGGYNDVRTQSPSMILFEEQMSYSLGIGSSLANVQTNGTSAYRELAMVYKPDVKVNSGQSYPTTPGHFEDPAACVDN